MVRNVVWADLKFPPINLWVMATLPESELSKGETTHIHRRQRPGLKCLFTQPNALQKTHKRLAALIAGRGGKHGN